MGVDPRAFYPEQGFGGFSNVDGTIVFYQRVRALLKPEFTVLDVGCGRGEYADDQVSFRRNLRSQRGLVSKVIGIDTDPVGVENPTIDEFRQLDLSLPQWPVEAESIDLIFSDWVMEHVGEPSAFLAECRRVLKPGGHLCLRTTNRLGYAGIASSLIPNGMHVRLLSKFQPGRLEEDVFPTYYRANTVSKLKAFLERAGFDACVFAHESEPAYLGFSSVAYWFGMQYRRFAPSVLYNTLMAFARKRS